LDNNSDGAALRFPSGGAPEMMRRVVPWWCASGFRFQLSEKYDFKKTRLIGSKHKSFFGSDNHTRALGTRPRSGQYAFGKNVKFHLNFNVFIKQ
jgi:hypothetical protein